MRPLKVSSEPIGSWIGTALHFSRLAHHVDNAVEISAHNVHLVDIRHTRNLVFLSLTPNGLRLRLNAALCAENRYGTIENTQGTLNLNGEVNVTRGVDDVDTVW